MATKPESNKNGATDDFAFIKNLVMKAKNKRSIVDSAIDSSCSFSPISLLESISGSDDSNDQLINPIEVRHNQPGANGPIPASSDMLINPTAVRRNHLVTSGPIPESITKESTPKHVSNVKFPLDHGSTAVPSPKTSVEVRKAILGGLREKKLAQMQEMGINGKKITDLKPPEDAFKTSQENTKKEDIETSREIQKQNPDSTTPTIDRSVVIEKRRKAAALFVNKIKTGIDPASTGREVTSSTNSSPENNEWTGINTFISEIQTIVKTSSPAKKSAIQSEPSTRAVELDSSLDFTLDDISSCDGKDETARATQQTVDSTLDAASLDDISSENENDVEEGEITDISSDDGMNHQRKTTVSRHKKPNQSSVRILIAGDSRMNHLFRRDGLPPKSLDKLINDNVNVKELCDLVSQRLAERNDYHFVLLGAFHFDLLYTQTVTVRGVDVELMKVNKKIDVKDLLKYVNVCDKRWRKMYPDIKFIWLTPYPINILAYNEEKILAVVQDRPNPLMEFEKQENANMIYWEHIKDLMKYFKIIGRSVTTFPLHDILLSDPGQREAFNNGYGALPLNQLERGVFPSVRLQAIFENRFLHFVAQKFPMDWWRFPKEGSVYDIPEDGKSVKLKLNDAVKKFFNQFEEEDEKKSTTFTKRGDEDGLLPGLSDMLSNLRELYKLYEESPSRHPEYSQQMQQYTWELANRQMKNSTDNSWLTEDNTGDFRIYWVNFLNSDFDKTWESQKNEFFIKTYGAGGIDVCAVKEVKGSKLGNADDSSTKDNNHRSSVEKNTSRRRDGHNNQRDISGRKRKRYSRDSHKDTKRIKRDAYSDNMNPSKSG